MKPELKNKLYETYPLILNDNCFDFAIGDGWYPLVEGVCEQINYAHKRWKMPDEVKVTFVQVKEKFAGIRIYHDVLGEVEDDACENLLEFSAYVDGAVSMAEFMSFTMCEVCGSPGRRCNPNNKFWMKTRCSKHRDYAFYPSESKRKGSVCIDLDGVINSYTSGFTGIDDLPDPPVPGAMNFIQELVANKYKVYVHSTRNEHEAGRKAIRAYLKEHGLPKEVLDKIGIIDGKPKAKIYLDDRAWEFKGMFPTLKEIEHFKPWNK